MFHPSLFENSDKDTPKFERTLLSIRKERDQLVDTDVENLKSPLRYELTTTDEKVAGSNTKYLFKNLYGETPLTFLFFSDNNIDNIQKLTRYLVWKETQYVIDNQSPSELLVIMRSIFLEYSAHPPLIDTGMSEEVKQALFARYTREVTRLNKIVTDTVVPRIVSQLRQYLDYLRDVKRIPVYETPQNVSISGEREYRSVTQVLIGGDL